MKIFSNLSFVVSVWGYLNSQISKKSLEEDRFMVQYFTTFLTIIILLYSFSLSEAKLTLQEVRTASKNVLVAFFTSDTIDVNEVDIENVSEWQVNGQPVKNIYRYAT